MQNDFINNVKQASLLWGRKCDIYMDLGGNCEHAETDIRVIIVN